MQLEPTVKKERIQTIDLLRGISLLGILLVNILSFNYPVNYVSMQEYLTKPADIQAEKWLTIFVQGSFYPLFAWLFGYGLQMQKTKALSLNQNFMPIASRRLSVLLLFGILHAFGVWYGDILITYAVMGFILLVLLKLKPVLQTVISLILFVIFNGFMLIVYWIASIVPDSENLELYSDITNAKSSLEAYRYGDWVDAFMQRLTDLSMQLGPLMWLQALFTILPFMLAGAAASQWRLIERAKDLKWLWFTFAIIALPLGVFLKYQIYNEDLKFLGYAIGVLVGAPILTIGYAAIIVLIALIPYILKITTPINCLGRMSMTTYLMQSILQSILFYGFGFGLYGKLSVDNLILIALLIFIFQMAFAWVWLNFFKQGPVEMLWKRITYRKKHGK